MHNDSTRWDARYLEARRDSFEQPRPFLIKFSELLPMQGLALDVAMGLGGNAELLLSRGLRVVGVDISRVAVYYAHSRLSNLAAVIADMRYFYFPENTFDLIINFYYLERDLFSCYRHALKPGGLLIVETLTQAMQEIKPEIDPAFLLAPGELRHSLSDMDILVYEEGWFDNDKNHPRAVARLIARKQLPKSN